MNLEELEADFSVNLFYLNDYDIDAFIPDDGRWNRNQEECIMSEIYRNILLGNYEDLS